MYSNSRILIGIKIYYRTAVKQRIFINSQQSLLIQKYRNKTFWYTCKAVLVEIFNFCLVYLVWVGWKLKKNGVYLLKVYIQPLTLWWNNTIKWKPHVRFRTGISAWWQNLIELKFIVNNINSLHFVAYRYYLIFRREFFVWIKI